MKNNRINKYDKITDLSVEQVKYLKSATDFNGNTFYVDPDNGVIYTIKKNKVVEVHCINISTGYDRVNWAIPGDYVRLQMHVFMLNVVFGVVLNEGEEIHHIDGNKLNNKVENLLYCEDHNVHMKVTELQARYDNDPELLKYIKLWSFSGRKFTLNDLEVMKIKLNLK